MAKKLSPRKASTTKPLWQGPEFNDDPMCGVTQSLLSRVFVCPERARLLLVYGLRERQEFKPSLEYGNLWHLCEEHHAARKPWEHPLKQMALSLMKQYPNSKDEITQWYEICRRQFPIYLNEYAKEDKRRKPYLQEESFAVKYSLPSGRCVLLRGKFDAIMKEPGGLRLWENKARGEVNEEKIVGEIGSNLQTMLYLVALREKLNREKSSDKVLGVIYNIIKRPLSDWKGHYSIRQRKGRKTKKGVVGAETLEEYYNRVGEMIDKNRGDFFFRIKVEVHKHNLRKFEEECLIPRLEWLCNWWEWIKADPDNPFRKGNQLHWRAPFGVYDPLLEGRQGDYYKYVNTGSMAGLEKVDRLFGELNYSAK